MRTQPARAHTHRGTAYGLGTMVARYWAVSAGTPGIGVTRTVPGKMTSPANTPLAAEIVNVAEPLLPQITPSLRAKVSMLKGSPTSSMSRTAVTLIKHPVRGSKSAPVKIQRVALDEPSPKQVPTDRLALSQEIAKSLGRVRKMRRERPPRPARRRFHPLGGSHVPTRRPASHAAPPERTCASVHQSSSAPLWVLRRCRPREGGSGRLPPCRPFTSQRTWKTVRFASTPGIGDWTA